MNTLRKLLQCWFPIISAAIIAGCDEEIEHPLPTAIVIDPRADTVFDVKYPFWSGDGSKILFFGHVFGDEGDGLYEVAPEGGSPKLLMIDSLMKRNPILSPDGSMIAYLCAPMHRLWGAARVWVVNRDGTAPRDVTPMGGNWEYIRWSPDGRFLIFDGGVEACGVIQYQVVRADIATGELKMLTRHPLNGRDASYTSDGNKIVYVSDYLPSDLGVKVWIMNADGTNHMPLDSSSRSSTFPRIRPSTNELWFSFGIDLTYDAGTYMINLDTVPLPATQSSFILKSKDHFLRESQWSLNGERFISLYATTSRTPDLVISEACSVSYTFLTSGFNVVLFSPSWAPDGKKLVFYAIPKGEDASAIFTCDIPSYSLRRITILNN